MIFTGWDHPRDLVLNELAQREYEGCVVPKDVKDMILNLKAPQDDYDFAKVEPLYQALEALKPAKDFPYVQPWALEAIRKERPAGPRKLRLDLSEAELLDRFHGAWAGRACGCALGKPVEGLGMRGALGMSGRASIKKYLQNRGHWPLDFYFSGKDTGDGIKIGCELSQREKIAFMEPDDDIHYSLIGLYVLERFGPDFKWQDVANSWNSTLPYNAICTAETQAILNYNLAVPRTQSWKPGLAPVEPSWTSSHRNPYREWIGAQIRADGWAYACAGMPELAAEFAWRDASWTHVANGIYGEMFYAAVIAAAFAEKDPWKLAEIGLSEIPKNCKLAEALREGLVWVKECKDFESFMDRLDAKYKGMSPVHTVNNALIVLMSLFYGEMDTHQAICTSVMGAIDTDCNGATTGSIVGAAAGRKKFKAKLLDPLHETIKPHVFGFQEIKLGELAERTMVIHKKVKEYAQKRS